MFLHYYGNFSDFYDGCSFLVLPLFDAVGPTGSKRFQHPQSH